MHCIRISLLGAAMFLAATAVALAGPYGALATSPDADFGYSYNFDSSQDARARALQECRQHSRECEVKQTFQNVCVSVAKASNGAMGWSWGFGRETDDRNAVTTCRENNGRDCELSVRFCTGNPEKD